MKWDEALEKGEIQTLLKIAEKEVLWDDWIENVKEKDERKKMIVYFVWKEKEKVSSKEEELSFLRKLGFKNPGVQRRQGEVLNEMGEFWKEQFFWGRIGLKAIYSLHFLSYDWQTLLEEYLKHYRLSFSQTNLLILTLFDWKQSEKTEKIFELLERKAEPKVVFDTLKKYFARPLS